MTGGAPGPAWGAMRSKRGFGILLGGLVGVGSLAAMIAVGVAPCPASIALAPQTLAAYSSGALDVGNPNGHAYVPPAGRAANTSGPHHVIGAGTPASCTSAAVVRGVAEGGTITFHCGPKPVTITMTATAKVVNTSHQVVLDGGGKVTLSGDGKIRILYMNTCDVKQKYITHDCWEQQWPQLVVQNLTFKDAYSAVRQSKTSNYGGGAIFAEGGQLKVVNSAFLGNRCYQDGPDLGGAAIRAFGMYTGSLVYITHDTFSGNTCSNGAALSGLDASFDVTNSLLTANKAIGWGANPAHPGTPGGGSGGAIYTDGDHYNLIIDGTVMRDNSAREGGGAIFFVVNARGGTLRIEYSTLDENPSGVFQNAPGIFDHVDGRNTAPVVVHSTIG
jgi:Chlamydia polymorphic membrane protein (Chlamydia_PMP) repeat